MKKAKIKHLLVLLAVVMCIGLMPIDAWAAQVGTDVYSVDAPGMTENAARAVLPDSSSKGGRKQT